ncbi:DUF4249 family protein [Mesonia ostreae]|uniref:DUF4249 family protein n=1 Tax=Mesonia ostreae TaxID=861110 RepID=A0ABU2KLL1_9FLAO|nr:DUF4249 family protein [Mesonia ostreae]MDT0295553.1 DUF4249 family protein [Mesonia ostreae]
MKKLFFLLIIFPVFLTSCQDVIEVDLEEKEPKLVVEAIGIQQENNNEGLMKVLLTTTTPFFETSFSYVDNAQVSVIVNEQEFVLSNEFSTEYVDTIPMLENSTYKLRIVYEQEVYEGETQLYATVPFDYVEQSTNSFSEDFTAINAYFTDPPELGNNYYFYFKAFGYDAVIDSSDDKLINGNQVSTFYSEELESGDVINIKIQGISARFNTYLSTLIQQANDSGSPFSTASASIRGNIVNTTTPNKFPLGYFRISQEFQTTYTVE